jgi:hypothetical protein
MNHRTDKHKQPSTEITEEPMGLSLDIGLS